MEAVRSTNDDIVQILASCVEQLPPQTVGDIMVEGVLVQRGFNHLLEEALGFPGPARGPSAHVCVSEGAAACLARPDVVRAYGEG